MTEGELAELEELLRVSEEMTEGFRAVSLAYEGLAEAMREVAAVMEQLDGAMKPTEDVNT